VNLRLHRASTLLGLIFTIMATGVRAEPFPATALREANDEEVLSTNRVIINLHLAGVYDDIGRADDSARCIDKALEISQGNSSGRLGDWLRNKSLNKLAHSYSAKEGANLQRFGEAVKGVESIEDPELAAHAYAKLGEKWHSSGEHTHGKELLLKSISKAKQVSDPLPRAAILATVARELHHIGLKQEATSLTAEGLRLVQAHPVADESRAIEVELIGNIIDNGERQRAVKMIDDLVKSISSPSVGRDTALFDTERSSLLVYLADQYATIDERAKAMETLDFALTKATGCSNQDVGDVRYYEHDYRLQPSLRVCKVRAEVAAAYAALGEWKLAESILPSIKDPRYRAMAMCKIAASLGNAGEKDRAVRLLDQAKGLCEETDHALPRVEILVNLAKAHVKLKNSPDQIQELLSQVEQQLP